MYLVKSICSSFVKLAIEGGLLPPDLPVRRGDVGMLWEAGLSEPLSVVFSTLLKADSLFTFDIFLSLSPMPQTLWTDSPPVVPYRGFSHLCRVPGRVRTLHNIWCVWFILLVHPVVGANEIYSTLVLEQGSFMLYLQ